jgi:TPP-dependent pyruvate/acetoin dehydrogenase alpha subunit
VKAIQDAGAATEAELEKVDAEVKAMAEEAASFALASPLPDGSTVTAHVYSEG